MQRRSPLPPSTKHCYFLKLHVNLTGERQGHPCFLCDRVHTYVNNISLRYVKHSPLKHMTFGCTTAIPQCYFTYLFTSHAKQTLEFDSIILQMSSAIVLPELTFNENANFFLPAMVYSLVFRKPDNFVVSGIAFCTIRLPWHHYYF